MFNVKTVTPMSETKIGELIACGACGTAFSSAFVAAYIPSYEKMPVPAFIWAVLMISILAIIASVTVYILPTGKVYRKKSNGKNIKGFTLSLRPIPESNLICVSDYDVEFNTFWGEVTVKMDCTLARYLPTVEQLSRAILLSGNPNQPDGNAKEQLSLFCNRANVILKDFSCSVSENYSADDYYDKALALVG